MRCRSRLLKAIALFVITVVGIPFALTVSGCDQLNKPVGHPSGSSGTNTRSSDSDGGLMNLGEGGSPAPTITAQPGDIQI